MVKVWFSSAVVQRSLKPHLPALEGSLALCRGRIRVGSVYESLSGIDGERSCMVATLERSCTEMEREQAAVLSNRTLR